MTALVTGYPTSFLATRVVERLLGDQRDVWCVVQTKSIPHAESLRNELPTEQRKRLRFLEGDSAALDLGLSGAEFTMLAHDVEEIHHCAAVSYLGAPRKVAEATNVGGAREIVELAEAARDLDRLVSWSTAMVSGARRGTVLEDELCDGPFHNPIDETRMRAEKIVREITDHVPTTVLRPAITVGDSKTGAVDRLEGPYLLVLLMLNAPQEMSVPMPGRGDSPLNIVPIDYVVDAGFAILGDPTSVGHGFHIVDPNPKTAREVFEQIAREVGRPVPRGFVPTQVATRMLRAPGLERFSVPRTFLEQMSTEVLWNDRRARAILDATALRCPSFDEYVGPMVDFVRVAQDRELALS